MDENYLLETETAKKLYFEYAKDMPIFDYHCHLPVREIAEDRKFENITQLWLSGDHYKWRALRANGIPEEYITGNKSDQEKFRKWAETVPYTIGNPLLQWTYFELRKYFGIQDYLTAETADEIWEKCNVMLEKKEFSARNLIKKSNVKALCTTDDPIDTLEYHKKINADETFDVRVLPTFRPDIAIEIGHEKFQDWTNTLGSITGITIKTIEDFLEALQRRIKDFHAVGCRLSDHGLADAFYMKSNQAEISNIFNKGLQNERLTVEEQIKFRSAMLINLGKEYAKHGWAMQLHMGALRNTNTRMLNSLGINTGFDTIADFTIGNQLANLLDDLDQSGSLPKTILYCLNPRDNHLLSSMIGNFQSDVPGKIQFGSAWWFNDHEDGMIDQMKALASIGLFSRFIGMLTDSRSFISYTRHEYFRRIVCNLVGSWVEDGSFYPDYDFLGKMIKGICYNNIKEYLDIEV